MRDDLARFPTPAEAFGRPVAASPVYGDLGNIPQLPNQPRHGSGDSFHRGAFAQAPSAPSKKGNYSAPERPPVSTHRGQTRPQGRPQGFAVKEDPRFQRRKGTPTRVQFDIPDEEYRPNGQHPSRSMSGQPPRELVRHDHKAQRYQNIEHVEPMSQAERQYRDLRALFDEVDRDGNGYLTEKELSSALVNGDYTRFDPKTVQLMIRMFDNDNDGALYFTEFGQLWKYLHEWRNIFDKFDINSREQLSLTEFTAALAAFGYNLSEKCVAFMFKFNSRKGRSGRAEMSFDLFVQACINIKSITDLFKKYDTDRDGVMTIGFEQFMMEITDFTGR